MTEEEEDELFEPNIVNSTVYIISMALQIATFAINYRVSDFRLKECQNFIINIVFLNIKYFNVSYMHSPARTFITKIINTAEILFVSISFRILSIK